MNVKPGDLAIVVGGKQTPEMIGMIVKVERRCFSGDSLSGGHQARFDHSIPVWVCSSNNGIPTKILNTNTVVLMPERAIKDSLLRPVSGLPDEQHTEEHNKQEA